MILVKFSAIFTTSLQKNYDKRYYAYTMGDILSEVAFSIFIHLCCDIGSRLIFFKTCNNNNAPLIASRSIFEHLFSYDTFLEVLHICTVLTFKQIKLNSDLYPLEFTQPVVRKFVIELLTINRYLPTLSSFQPITSLPLLQTSLVSRVSCKNCWEQKLY